MADNENDNDNDNINSPVDNDSIPLEDVQPVATALDYIDADEALKNQGEMDALSPSAIRLYINSLSKVIGTVSANGESTDQYLEALSAYSGRADTLVKKYENKDVDIDNLSDFEALGSFIEEKYGEYVENVPEETIDGKDSATYKQFEQDLDRFIIEGTPLTSENTGLDNEPVLEENEPTPVEDELALDNNDFEPIDLDDINIEPTPLDSETAPEENEPTPVEDELALDNNDFEPIDLDDINIEPTPLDNESASVENEPTPVEDELVLDNNDFEPIPVPVDNKPEEVIVDEDSADNVNQNEGDINTPISVPDINMTAAEAVRLVNGDLNSLNFVQIEQIFAVLQDTNMTVDSPERSAFEKLRNFSESKVVEASQDGYDINIDNAAEVDAWLRINDDQQESAGQVDDNSRNNTLQGRVNSFYQEFDTEHDLEKINSSHNEAFNDNYNTLDEISANYDPFARTASGKLKNASFAKISDFYDNLEIDNSDNNVDFQDNMSLKKDMSELAVLEAQTELMQNPEFAQMPKDKQKEALDKAVLVKMQEAVANIITAEMDSRFVTENSSLVNQLKNPKLSPEDREKLNAELKAKKAIFDKEAAKTVSAHADYFADEPVALTDIQKKFLATKYKKDNTDLKKDITWNELSADDRELLIKGSAQLKDLALTPEQNKYISAPKSAPFKAKAATVQSVLYNRTQDLVGINKRIAQKTGVLGLWNKAKAFNKKMDKSHPKLWGFAKNFALSAAVGLAGGGIGLALLSSYKALKSINVIAKKAKKNNMGFYTYLKNNKQEIVALTTAMVGAGLSVAFAGADVLSHGIASAGGLSGQVIDQAVQNGGDVLGAASNLGSNMHGNFNAADTFNKIKEGGVSGVWGSLKTAATNPKTFLRGGLSILSGTAAAAVNLAHGDKKKAKEAFWGGFTGALVGLGAAGIANELGGHAPAPDNSVDGITGAAVRIPPAPELAPLLEIPDDDIVLKPIEIDGKDIQTPPELAPLLDIKEDDVVLHPVAIDDNHHSNDTSNDNLNDKSLGNRNGVGGRGQGGAGDVATNISLEESDKALYDEILKRRSIGSFDSAASEDMAGKDFAKYQSLVQAGKVDEAQEYLQKIHDTTEIKEAETARTVDSDDGKGLTKIKLKAQKNFNEYQEKINELHRMDEKDPSYAKAEAAADKALKSYTKSMVDLTDREFKDMVSRYENNGIDKATIDEIKAERQVLRHGKGEAVQEVVDKKVPGVGLFKKSDLNRVAQENITSHMGKGR